MFPFPHEPWKNPWLVGLQNLYNLFLGDEKGPGPRVWESGNQYFSTMLEFLCFNLKAYEFIVRKRSGKSQTTGILDVPVGLKSSEVHLCFPMDPG